jgi:Protein of unknown function (DUF1173)
MTTVELAGRRFSLEDLQEEPAKYAHWFKKARAEVGHGTCLCNSQRLRLQIRLRDGLFHLAVWPREGEAHERRGKTRGSNQGCDFYHASTESSGKGGYATAAIVERDDGSIDIAASTPLKVRAEEREAGVPRAESSSGTGKKRSSAGMLGVLHALWESASLHTWCAGWTRHWSRCWWQLRNVDGRIKGVPLSECLHVVRAWEPARREEIEKELAAFRARLGVREQYRYFGYVIGELKGYQPTEFGFRIELRHMREPFFASRQLMEAVEKSSPAVVASRENPDARVIVLMHVDVAPRGYMRVSDMAMMLTTKQYIPCESSFEVQMANALVEAERDFLKPLRYDGEADTFPDFELLDTSPKTIVEVFGMVGNEGYDRRKAEKQAIYKAKGQPVIEWDTRRPMPELRLQPNT